MIAFRRHLLFLARLAAVAALLLAGGLVLTAAGARPKDAAGSKKLIEMGWDEPDTRFLRDHIARMERTPFDGCVFHVMYRGADGRDSNFTWQVWGRRAFTRGQLQSAFDDLRATRFRTMRHNFLRVNATPADLDWFDDHSAVMANMRLAAQLARAGGCDGVMLDLEQYQAKLWWYTKQRDAGTRSWDEYAAQVRRRGAQVMDALQDGFPDLTVFLTFGYSLAWQERPQGALSQRSTGLVAPFTDGLFDAARGRTRIVDGHEMSYAYRSPAQFKAARQRVRSDLLPIVANPDAYRARGSVGFGIWMDNDWRAHGWDTAKPGRNYFPPDTFATALLGAVEATDEYVWIYSEKPRWWDTDTLYRGIPRSYLNAVKRAQKKAHGQRRRG